jgi:RimJ/RimL family protein N-acetyltransferase
MRDAQPAITLRRARETDIPTFVRLQTDAQAAYAAAFGAVRSEHDIAAHWAKVLRDSENETWVILAADEPVGFIGMFRRGADREITYWMDRALWGRGIAATAVSAFVGGVPFRPIFARVAADNVRSVRVLEKCGFSHVNTERGFAEQRGVEIDEFVYRLDQ